MAYLKRCLVPTLKRGDIVMMDSLPVHKLRCAQVLKQPCELLTSPVSPDLNPIEMAFSNSKRHEAAEHPAPHAGSALSWPRSAGRKPKRRR